MRLKTLLTDGEIRPSELLDNFIGAGEDEGAIVSFCGLARPTGAGGARVSMLRLERHPRLTELSLERIGSDCAARFNVSRLLLVHRWGVIPTRHAIVFVAAAARHRRDAFLAADYLMDRLKTEAVLWKKEEGIHGSRWIEPTDQDRAAVARWEQSWPE